MDMKGHLSPVLRTDVARTSSSLSGEMEREIPKSFSSSISFRSHYVGSARVSTPRQSSGD